MAILSFLPGQVGVVPNANPNNSLPAAQLAPQILYISTNDTNATVTTAGYLNPLQLNTVDNFQFNNSQMALVYTTDSGPQWYQVTVNSSGVVTLVADVNPGDVLLPVSVGHIATFTTNTGQIGDIALTAVHGGNIQAGLSGTSGTLTSFPPTAANGHFTIAAVNNAGGFNSVLSNTNVGQGTQYNLPDPGVATASILLDHSAGTQTIVTGNLTLTAGNITATAGNIVATAGNISATAGSLSAGTTVTAGTGITATTGNIVATAGNLTAGSSGNAGIVTSFPGTAANGSFVFAAANNANNFAATLSNAAVAQATTYVIPDPANANGRVLVGATATPFTSNHSLVASGTGGLIADAGYQMKVVAQAAVAGGAAAQTVNDAFCTSASMVVCTWNDTTNAVSIQKAVAGNGSFVVTSSGDPGASHINYIITKV